MTVAFAHCEPGTPLLVDGNREPYFAQGGPLAMGNFAGLPALVAPAGHDEDGLPIGVQLMGPQWSEARLFGICRALESGKVLPGFKPPPL
jgi:amidase